MGTLREVAAGVMFKGAQTKLLAIQWQQPNGKDVSACGL